MKKKSRMVRVDAETHEALKYIAKSLNLSMTKLLTDVTSPLVQILSSYKPKDVNMTARVSVLAGEVTFAFAGKRTLMWGSGKEPKDILSSKLEKEREQ